jgi:hypothetical protein
MHMKKILTRQKLQRSEKLLRRVIEPADRISGNDEIVRKTTNFLLRGTELFTQNGRRHFG